jgi:hypothetical protein
MGGIPDVRGSCHPFPRCDTSPLIDEFSEIIVVYIEITLESIWCEEAVCSHDRIAEFSSQRFRINSQNASNGGTIQDSVHSTQKLALGDF